MKLQRIKIIVLVGILAFVGVIIIQIYWLRQGFDYEEKKFSQNIQVSLLDVVNEINKFYGYKTPLTNPVQKLSEDYYVVNIHNDFDAGILEFYLTNTFVKKGLNMDYEYAIYDCETDAMVYGSYVNMNKANKGEVSAPFPKASNLVYYFALRFPEKNNYILASLQRWVILSIIMVIVLFIFLYSIYVILQQKKYADLQRDFINNMTHEFKTPLSSILIASNYLAKQPLIAEDKKLDKYAHIIIDQSNKLDNHIEKILNLAKADITPITLNKSPININELITSAVDTITLKYPEASIKIDTTNSDHIIMGDAFHFTNIVYNFLDNSIKYCERIPNINIKIFEEPDRLVVRFSDNGIGIHQKYIKHIFGKFYRVPNNKKKEVNGFGLGLYYVKKICELHHWKLTIESILNTGTVVNLSIKK
ncbi:MAG: HAMP domain-containing sensor histidine kinase [Ferruginibacter sp.]